MTAPTLSDLIALRAAEQAAASTYDRAVNDALAADFPRHPFAGGTDRRWDVVCDVLLHVWFGLDNDGGGAWVSGTYAGNLRRSRATGPTPYAAVLAALEALDDTEARDALRAAVEVTR